jgi:hypothetical protein
MRRGVAPGILPLVPAFITLKDAVPSGCIKYLVWPLSPQVLMQSQVTSIVLTPVPSTLYIKELS